MTYFDDEEDCITGLTPPRVARKSEAEKEVYRMLDRMLKESEEKKE